MISTKRSVLSVLKDHPLILLNMFAQLSPHLLKQLHQLQPTTQLQHLAQVDISGMDNNVSLVTYLNIGIITPTAA
jgi:hypothetical protein